LELDFYTKYGDGGVDLSPIADLMKSSVSLAAYLNVPESILNAAPSDGLFGDEKQTTTIRRQL
jgi:NAD+ synthase